MPKMGTFCPVTMLGLPQAQPAAEPPTNPWADLNCSETYISSHQVLLANWVDGILLIMLLSVLW
jgi:hypothetical protein